MHSEKIDVAADLARSEKKIKNRKVSFFLCEKRKV
jgi:hypothetical protein